MYGQVLVVLGAAWATEPAPTPEQRLSIWVTDAIESKLLVAIEVPRGPNWVGDPPPPYLPDRERPIVTLDQLPAQLATANREDPLLTWSSLPLGRRTVVLATRPDRPTLLDAVVTLPPAAPEQPWADNLEAWRLAVEKATGEELRIEDVPQSSYICRVEGEGVARDLLAQILDCKNGNAVWSLSWGRRWPPEEGEGFQLSLRAHPGLEDPLDATARPSIGQRW